MVLCLVPVFTDSGAFGSGILVVSVTGGRRGLGKGQDPLGAGCSSHQSPPCPLLDSDVI